MILKQIPNSLTILRLVLIIPFLIFLFDKQYQYALYTFFAAGVSDGLDGWLARHFNWQTVFGSVMDPLADKLLVASSFFSMAWIGKLPWWLWFLVFARDITICLGATAWYFLIQHKMDFEPTRLSKFNTAFQLSLVIGCLFELAYFPFPFPLVNSLIILIACTTTASYIDYVWTWGHKAWHKPKQVL